MDVFAGLNLARKPANSNANSIIQPLSPLSFVRWICFCRILRVEMHYRYMRKLALSLQFVVVVVVAELIERER